MPIYGYRCTSCGHEVEVLQKLSDPPLKTCPECGGELRKLLYPAGVIFKGSGFYTTDYKGSSGGGAGGGSGSSSSSSSDSNGTTGSKPAEKGGEGGTKPAAESKAESKPAKADSSD